MLVTASANFALMPRAAQRLLIPMCGILSCGPLLHRLHGRGPKAAPPPGTVGRCIRHVPYLPPATSLRRPTPYGVGNGVCTRTDGDLGYAADAGCREGRRRWRCWASGRRALDTLPGTGDFRGGGALGG